MLIFIKIYNIIKEVEGDYMDKRILNTKKKVTNTLLVLLKDYRLEDITVLMLCKKADINRTTFYKYYKDVNDLVLKIENSLINDLKQHIVEIKRNYLISFTSKETYTRLLGDNGDHTFLRRILRLVYDQSIEEWQKLLKKASKDDLEKIYSFIVDGSVSIIRKWIKDNCQEEPANIAIFINKICMSGLSSFI